MTWTVSDPSLVIHTEYDNFLCVFKGHLNRHSNLVENPPHQTLIAVITLNNFATNLKASKAVTVIGILRRGLYDSNVGANVTSFMAYESNGFQVI